MFDFFKSRNDSEIKNGFPIEDKTQTSAEVFSLEHLQKCAAELARTQRPAPKGKRGFDLLARLADNKKSLVDAFETLTDQANSEPSTPSAEWLADNFHIVEEQLHEIRQDLPRKFYRELPKLSSGNFDGFPRIYQLAFEMVSHTDNSLEPAMLRAFLEAYQAHSAAHYRRNMGVPDFPAAGFD